MTNRHWYEIIAEMVAAEGVRDVFALLGDANMHMATHLVSLGTRMMHVRHEHCAVAAAMAYARKSGQVGVATVTCGPGLTQVMTALPAAVRARIPLVVLAGEAPLGGGWYNQGIEQAPFVTATGAAYHSLHHPPRFAVGIRDEHDAINAAIQTGEPHAAAAAMQHHLDTALAARLSLLSLTADTEPD